MSAAAKQAFEVTPEQEVELNDLRMSKDAQPLFDAVKKHIAENVEPILEEFARLGEEQKRVDRWSWHPRQLELLEGAKNKAKASGLWNFFLPSHNDIGRGPRHQPAAIRQAQILCRQRAATSDRPGKRQAEKPDVVCVSSRVAVAVITHPAGIGPTGRPAPWTPPIWATPLWSALTVVAMRKSCPPP